jgi:precorrin-3B synthase
MAAPHPTPVAGPGGQRRGACPSVRRPLAAGDGLLVRLRLAGADVTTAQARTIAAVAERHGSGVVELTSRANVQVRGVRPGTLAGLVSDLTDAGLVPLHPREDVQADVVVAPAAGVDPTEVVDVRPLAEELRSHLSALALGGLALHPKAGVVLDGGGAVSVRGIPAAVALGAARRTTGDVVYELALGAALPPVIPVMGGTLVPVVAPARAAEAAARLLRRAATDGAEPARMRDVVAVHGVGSVVGEVADLVEWVDPAGLERAALPLQPDAPLGVQGIGDGDLALVGALPPLGRLDAELLRAMAAALERHGAEGVRVTPGRSVLVAGLATGAAAELAAELGRLGFVTDAADPAAGVVACAGAPRCAAAHADTQADGHRVVGHLRPSGAEGLDATAAAGGRRGPTVHLSGCAKRCASRHAHDVTLVASTGGYDLFVRDRGAPAGERHVAGGLSLDEALARAGEASP